MLFRLNGTTEHDAAIVAYFDAAPRALVELGRTWFMRVRHVAPGLREVLHDGVMNVCIGDAPFAYVGIFKAHVNVGFHRGASLPDPEGLLIGEGRSMRHVKLRLDAPVDEAALMALIAAAHEDMAREVERAH